jgi:hypothetical protein
MNGPTDALVPAKPVKEKPRLPSPRAELMPSPIERRR